MSLEIALAENTAALRDLLAHLKSGIAIHQPSPEEIDANIEALNSPKPPAAKGKSTSAATPASAAPTPPTAEGAVDAAQEKTDAGSDPSAASAATAASASTAATDAPDYATTAKAVTDLVKAKGRDTAAGVLSEFGAANLKEVPPEKFADVIAACKEAAK